VPTENPCGEDELALVPARWQVWGRHSEGGKAARLAKATQERTYRNIVSHYVHSGTRIDRIASSEGKDGLLSRYAFLAMTTVLRIATLRSREKYRRQHIAADDLSAQMPD